MFCPECRQEYREGIEICADCQVTLIPDLPQNQPMKEVRWIKLHELPSSIYAEMVKEALEKEGIPSYVKADFFSSAGGLKGNYPGSHADLYVPEVDAEKASSILEQMLDHL